MPTSPTPTTPKSETLAIRTRRVADQIHDLPEKVLESFQLSNPSERVGCLQEIENTILHDMLPVMGWLERRQQGSAREFTAARLSHALHEAVECAGMDIPEYVRGKVAPTQAASPGQKRVAKLVVVAREFSGLLGDLANDIDVEETKGQSVFPPTEFDLLRNLITTLSLKGNEAVVVAALCAASGQVSIADLAIQVSWNNPQDNWNSARRRLNKKFKKHGWRFSTKDNNAVAKQIPTGRK